MHMKTFMISSIHPRVLDLWRRNSLSWPARRTHYCLIYQHSADARPTMQHPFSVTVTVKIAAATKKQLSWLNLSGWVVAEKLILVFYRWKPIVPVKIAVAAIRSSLFKKRSLIGAKVFLCVGCVLLSPVRWSFILNQVIWMFSFYLNDLSFLLLTEPLHGQLHSVQPLNIKEQGLNDVKLAQGPASALLFASCLCIMSKACTFYSSMQFIFYSKGNLDATWNLK